MLPIVLFIMIELKYIINQLFTFKADLEKFDKNIA